MLLMVPTTPTMVNALLPPRPIFWPSAVVSAKYFFARYSSTMQTAGASIVSPSLKVRPAITGMCIALK